MLDTIPPAFTIAIIGGGFSGAAAAYACANAPSRGVKILLIEPAADLGKGLAYGTSNPAHRLNVPAHRIFLTPETPNDFLEWGQAACAWAEDDDATAPDGRIFPQRQIFGRFVAARLAPLIAAGTITHVRAKAEDLEPVAGRWRITIAEQTPLPADAVILATGHLPSDIPFCINGIRHARRFITDATPRGALAPIRKNDRILIIGTGLGMADAAATLEHIGHTGAILAISRRGQISHSHAATACNSVAFTAPPKLTATTLLRAIRCQIKTAEQSGLMWQGVIDALREQGQDIWSRLPPPERARLMRHARPYWDTHRHRLPPPVDSVLAKARAEGRLTIRAGTVAAATMSGETFRVGIRVRENGMIVHEEFDSIIIATGPAADCKGLGLLGNLVERGVLCRHPAGLGFACDDASRAVDAHGRIWENLFLSGPLARGHFGELTGAPEIARQATAIAQQAINAHNFTNLYRS